MTRAKNKCVTAKMRSSQGYQRFLFTAVLESVKKKKLDKGKRGLVKKKMQEKIVSRKIDTKIRGM
jgi:hypothetical protein